MEGVCCIKVLGAGCKSCHDMFENTRKAATTVGLSVEVEYVTNMEEVMSYGAMTIPVLVVNEKVVAAGKVLNQSEIEVLLK
jgi:small redox-active disulfide protein 2